MMGSSVGGIYGQIELDNKGFKGVLQQSKSDMARTALEMQKSSRVKIDLNEYKKLSSQLGAIQGRARETRLLLLKATAGSDEAKKLKKELGGLNTMISTLKTVTGPATKEMNRLANADKAAAKEALANAKAQKQKRLSIVMASTGTKGGAVGAIGQAAASGGPQAAAAAAVLAAAAATYALGSASSQTAADIELQTVAFEAMMKSASKAKAFVAELLIFAKNTPFEFSGLVENARLLMAFRFEAEKILPILRVIGDAAGGDQEKISRISIALGQMKGKTKVSAQEMMQLTEAGIGAWDMLAKKIGVDVPTAMKMAEAGQISSVTGINAILEGMQQQFGGGMEKASKTAIGSWSNIKDTIRITLAEIGNGINDRLKPLMTEFMQRFPQAWEQFKGKAKAAWSIVKPILQDIWGSAKMLWPEFKQLIKGLISLTGGAIVAGLTAIAAAFKVILYAVKAVEYAFKALDSWTGGSVWNQDKKKPAKTTKAKPAADPSKGSFLLSSDANAVDPEATGAISSAATEIASLNREIALNGNTTKTAAMQYAILKGEYAAADSATKQQLLSLAKQADAQDKTREAVKKHSDEQKKLAEESLKTAEAIKTHYAQKLQETLNNMKSWAGEMADAMKGFASETLQTVKDQLNKERDARNAAADDAKSRYEKLAEIGNLGARAMTAIAMFKGGKEKSDIGPGDITGARIRDAAREVQAKRGNEAAMTSKVQGQLYGNGINDYEAFSKSKNNDMFGVKLDDQIKLLQSLVAAATGQLTALEKMSRVRA